MTPQEFKAWFDGFTEAFDNRVPTKAQWARVKERVAEIDGKPVTERVFVDRYYPSYPPYYWRQPTYWGTCGSAAGAATISNHASASVAYSAALASGNNGPRAIISFNSTQAMSDLGRADAKALAA